MAKIRITVKNIFASLILVLYNVKCKLATIEYTISVDTKFLHPVYVHSIILHIISYHLMLHAQIDVYRSPLFQYLYIFGTIRIKRLTDIISVYLLEFILILPKILKCENY